MHPGQSVAIGVRRVHVLPTPLSSFTACATSEALAEALAQQPLLGELATRMKTRVSARVEPRSGMPDARVRERRRISPARPSSPRDRMSPTSAEWLLQRGADEVLVLPRTRRRRSACSSTGPMRRCARATLAVSASMLRHVSAEAVYVGIVPDARRPPSAPHGMRALLDARSEAQAVHGLEMRTELRFGDVANELARAASASRRPDADPRASRDRGLASASAELLVRRAVLEPGADRVATAGAGHACTSPAIAA